jgi:MinD superfamily P-loop ATPase
VILAVASGKGGTGKTTFAANLALSLEQEICFLDCDVEEPNAHLLLHPQITAAEPVFLPVPEYRPEKCTGCGTCVEICAYSALALIGESVMTFTEMCHGCGGCIYFCPTGALTEGRREIGVIEEGSVGKLFFAQGRLKVGEALVPPVIKALRRKSPKGTPTIVDCPPGTSCPVIQAVRGADFCVVVTEPTPFGQHDLDIAADMLKVLGIPFGVLINRADLGDAGVKNYCRERDISILAELPFDREIARCFAAGIAFTERFPRWRGVFREIWEKIRRSAAHA